MAAKAAQPFERLILCECTLGAAILCVVAGWRFTLPPRALVRDAPLAVHIHTDKAMFQVLISPGKVGSDSFALQLMKGDGSPLQVEGATLAVSLPSRGIEEIERPGTLGPDGGFGTWTMCFYPCPGTWHMRINALVTDFEKITLEGNIEVEMR